MMIEIAHANPQKQHIITIDVAPGTSIQKAIEASGILQLFPEIKHATMKVGVFGNHRELSDEIKAGERIEIYRPLLIDPKEARRLKAKKNK